MRFLPAKRIALARFLTGDTLTVISSVFSCSSAIEVGAWGYQKRSACGRDYARRRVSWATFIYNAYVLDNNFAIIKYVNSRRFPHLAEVLVKILVHLHLSNLLKCSTHSWSESIKATIISAAVIAFSAYIKVQSTYPTVEYGERNASGCGSDRWELLVIRFYIILPKGIIWC